MFSLTHTRYKLRLLTLLCYLRVPFQLASPPGFHVAHIPNRNLVLLSMWKCVFWHIGIFSLPAAGIFSCSRLRGTQGTRRNTRAPVGALADARGTCSGGSKLQIPTGRHSEHVEPSRPLQTHVQGKECPTAHVISGILNVINVVRQYLVMDFFFPATYMPDMRPLLAQNKINLYDVGRVYGLFSSIWPLDGWAFSPATHSCTSIIMFKVNNSTQQDCCTCMI